MRFKYTYVQTKLASGPHPEANFKAPDQALLPDLWFQYGWTGIQDSNYFN